MDNVQLRGTIDPQLDRLRLPSLLIMAVSVSEVAAIIGALVVFVQLTCPLFVSCVTVGSLKKTNNATTWSVLGRLLNGSLRPYILRTDTASRVKVDRRLQALSAFSALIHILIGVAATVTPLGLHSTLKAHDLKDVPFRYIRDDSPVGQATQPRDEYNASRKCGGGMLATPCPGNDDGYMYTRNSTGEYLDPIPGHDDPYLSTTIAANITDVFSNAVRKEKETVASIFDIQWRASINYNNNTDPGSQMDQGRPRYQDKFRYSQQMLLDNKTWPIEGLIVSMSEQPGIGFRNHTLPPSSQYGYHWTESILWLTPETTCSPLNLSFEYSIAPSTLVNISESWKIVDHGAFVKIPVEFPDVYHSSQSNAQLRERAWLAAATTNRILARRLNLTRKDYKTGTEYFIREYSNSSISSPPEPGKLSWSTFGKANFNEDFYDASLPGILSDFGKSSNMLFTSMRSTWNMSFFHVDTYARGFGGGNAMNISTVGMAGGLMLGLGSMLDTDGRLLEEPRSYRSDPGSNYSQPLYACMSAVKASVKRVTFKLDGTQSIQNLQVEDVRPVQYGSEAQYPIWAIEKTGRDISECDPFWGIFSEADIRLPTLETIKNPEFYIPAGMSAYWTSAGAGITWGSSYTSAGIDTPLTAFTEIYDTARSGQDFSGAINWSKYMKWKGLLRNSNTTGKIIDYIWTDLMANAVLGSKGLLSSSNSDVAFMPATEYRPGVGYDWRCAVPALLVAALYTCLLAWSGFMLITRRLNIGELRQILNQTAAGHSMTTERYHASDAADTAKTKEWAKVRGDETVIVAKWDVITIATGKIDGGGSQESQPLEPNTTEVAEEDQAVNHEEANQNLETEAVGVALGEQADAPNDPQHAGTGYKRS